MEYIAKIRSGKGKVFKDAFNIRTKVFVEEQGFVDIPDEIDESCWHIAVYDKFKPIGCGRMFIVGDGVLHIGRVAVLSEYRGKQVGKSIMMLCEQQARRVSAAELELCSQLHAKGFYERLGYEQAGEIFYEQDQPHIKMVKKL